MKACLCGEIYHQCGEYFHLTFFLKKPRYFDVFCYFFGEIIKNRTTHGNLTVILFTNGRANQLTDLVLKIMKSLDFQGVSFFYPRITEVGTAIAI